MNNVSHNKGWNSGTNQSHVEPPHIPLIKGIYDGKSDKDVAKIKCCRDPTSGMSDLYEFRMSVFDNGDPEEYLLLVHKFNMNIAVLRDLDMGTNMQYLCTLVHGEALHQFDSFSSDVESMETLTM